MPPRINKNAVAFSAINDFRIARHDTHSGNFRGAAHRIDNCAQAFHLKTFFNDKTRTQKQRHRA